MKIIATYLGETIALLPILWRTNKQRKRMERSQAVRKQQNGELSASCRRSYYLLKSEDNDPVFI